MIEIDGLTKRYGDKTALDRLSFVVEPGVVTGFLGPNGAGKSTTMRMIAGLDRAPGVTVINDGMDLLRVSGTTAEQIGAAAWRAHLPVYELTPTHASLEEAFMQVTQAGIVASEHGLPAGPAEKLAGK
jgi:ABC-type multidrug transport system ATPase subunit